MDKFEYTDRVLDTNRRPLAQRLLASPDWKPTRPRTMVTAMEAAESILDEALEDWFDIPLSQRDKVPEPTAHNIDLKEYLL